jgi:hypothetical protein
MKNVKITCHWCGILQSSEGFLPAGYNITPTTRRMVITCQNTNITCQVTMSDTSVVMITKIFCATDILFYGHIKIP